jgi:hypothetical protein
MTEDYKATPKQWRNVEGYSGKEGFSDCSCLLELRARVEALEEAQQPIHSSASAEQQARDLLERMGIESAQDLRAGDLTELANLIAAQSAPAPAGLLVERVARLLAEKDDPHEMWRIDARAAIREVAAAARAKDSKHWDPSGVAQMVTWGMVAQWLEQEAGQ